MNTIYENVILTITIAYATPVMLNVFILKLYYVLSKGQKEWYYGAMKLSFIPVIGILITLLAVVGVILETASRLHYYTSKFIVK